jgi:hypothetical protein
MDLGQLKRSLFASVIACSLSNSAQADPLALHEIMCNASSQVEQFAEAMLGAGLPFEEARSVVNAAAHDPDACVFVPVVVDDVHDEKELNYSGQTYVIRRVDVVALMLQTQIGWISQSIAPRVQFSLSAKSAKN